MNLIGINNMKLNNFLLVLTLALISGCNRIGTADFKEAALGTGGGEKSSDSGTDSSLIFAGISSVSNKKDTSLILNWISHPQAVAYDVFDTTSGSLTLINTVFGQSQSSISISSLTPSSTYKFRVRIKNASGLYDTNSNDMSVTLNSAPEVPSALSLINPLFFPAYDVHPTIRVSGVKIGDTVKIFSDSLCSIERGSAVSTGETADIILSTLVAGSYTLYANSTNASNNSSSCSTASASYVLSSCPGGYIGVPASAYLGVNPFCVAQFEMKNVASVATSQAASNPWVMINQSNAKTACTSLGTGYDLISNPEWMTIAHEIEKTAANWSSGIVGTGMLNRGHSDSTPNSALAVTNMNDPYIGTGNNSGQIPGSGWEQKRNHTLSNGQIIWDIAGNVWEWTNWTLGGALTSGPTSCAGAWTQFPFASCGAMSAVDYMPLNPAGVLSTNYNSNYGLGQFYGGTGGATLRGGRWLNGTEAGVFALYLFNGPSNTGSNIGFRCVFRP
jgi:formylglycine-generating enzyme required for sulfatase activity